MTPPISGSSIPPVPLSSQSSQPSISSTAAESKNQALIDTPAEAPKKESLSIRHKFLIYTAQAINVFSPMVGNIVEKIRTLLMRHLILPSLETDRAVLAQHVKHFKTGKVQALEKEAQSLHRKAIFDAGKAEYLKAHPLHEIPNITSNSNVSESEKIKLENDKILEEAEKAGEAALDSALLAEVQRQVPQVQPKTRSTLTQDLPPMPSIRTRTPEENLEMDKALRKTGVYTIQFSDLPHVADYDKCYSQETIIGLDSGIENTPPEPSLDGIAIRNPNQLKKDPTQQKWIIHLNGNGGTYEQSLSHLDALSKHSGLNVLAANYRGVGNSSPNKPPNTFSDLTNDAEAMLQHLTKQGVPLENILIHGYSTGGGPAAVLCQRYPELHLCAERTFSRYSDTVEALVGGTVQPYTGKGIGTALGRIASTITTAFGWQFDSLAALADSDNTAKKRGHRFFVDAKEDMVIRTNARLGEEFVKISAQNSAASVQNTTAKKSEEVALPAIANAQTPPVINVITLRAKSEKTVGHGDDWFGTKKFTLQEDFAGTPLDAYQANIAQAFPEEKRL